MSDQENQRAPELVRQNAVEAVGPGDGPLLGSFEADRAVAWRIQP